MITNVLPSYFWFTVYIGICCWYRGTEQCEQCRRPVPTCQCSVCNYAAAGRHVL